jgi:tol-pal system protein YbgF
VRALFLAAVAALLALPAAAQVEVMEPGGYNSSRQQQSSRRSDPAPQEQAGDADLYNQVLQLQDEVMKLNGIVEEQAEQIRQIKQQRLDDYIGLDKRLSALGGGAVPPGAPVTSAPPQGAGGASDGLTPDEQFSPVRADVAPMAPVATAPVAGEQPAYQAAFDLLRNKQYPEAESAFKAFLEQYPNGALAGNAHFWLGEFYAVVNGDNESARPHYESLVYQYPGSTKMPDALFKLGRIYMQEGDAVRGRELLQRVQDEYGSSDSAAKARDYLEQNP